MGIAGSWGAHSACQRPRVSGVPHVFPLLPRARLGRARPCSYAPPPPPPSLPPCGRSSALASSSCEFLLSWGHHAFPLLRSRGCNRGPSKSIAPQFVARFTTFYWRSSSLTHAARPAIPPLLSGRPSAGNVPARLSTRGCDPGTSQNRGRVVALSSPRHLERGRARDEVGVRARVDDSADIFPRRLALRQAGLRRDDSAVGAASDTRATRLSAGRSSPTATRAGPTLGPARSIRGARSRRRASST